MPSLILQRTKDGSLEAQYFVGTGHHVLRVQNTVQVGGQTTQRKSGGAGVGTER